MSSENKTPLLIVGTGGHALVIADAAIQSGQFDLRGFLDQMPASKGTTILGVPVLGDLELVKTGEHRDAAIIIAVGNNTTRERVVAELEKGGCSFATVIHPSATLGSKTSIGEGTVIMAGSIINPGTSIGRHVIVNTHASIDHHCQIGDFAHISPGVALAGGVVVGSRCHVGIGASVIERVEIGADTVIGAGAAVTESIPAGVVAVGVPARVARQRTEETKLG
ncbi:acetyltransferase [Candidatus Bipolaricaulota bacterium]